MEAWKAATGKVVMRIAFFLASFPKMSETFILNQITGLIDRGHQVDIYAFKKNHFSIIHSEIEKYNLMDKVLFFDAIPRSSLGFLRASATLLFKNFPWLGIRVARAIIKRIFLVNYSPQRRSFRALFAIPKNNHYDILHCQFGKLGPVVLDFKKIGAIDGKLVTSFRGYDATSYIDQHPNIYDKLFREGDLFLPVSESLKRRIVKAGCPKDRIRIHRSGIDYKKFQNKRSSLHNQGVLQLVSIARLVEKKGIEYAIQAVGKLTEKKYRVSYTVIGEGRLRSKFEKMIIDLKLADVVKLVGWQNHEAVIQYLKNAHILLAPSVTANGDQEGIPNAIKEAMAMGLPVVSTAHSGIPELVEDGFSGFLVPEKDVNGLCEKLQYLAENPQHGVELGYHGRKVIEAHWDINRLNDQLVNIYSQLIDVPNE